MGRLFVLLGGGICKIGCEWEGGKEGDGGEIVVYVEDDELFHWSVQVNIPCHVEIFEEKVQGLISILSGN
jgi:hypothetical protein